MTAAVDHFALARLAELAAAMPKPRAIARVVVGRAVWERFEQLPTHTLDPVLGIPDGIPVYVDALAPRDFFRVIYVDELANLDPSPGSLF